jgi:ADP-heptose:LPS heptosyltransferase
MRILVIRTSAMGDVALTAPVIAAMQRQYPGTELIVLTRKAFKPFFSAFTGVDLFFPDFNNRHKGLTGIFNLFLDIKKQKIDSVLDLHDVLRSKILRTFFRLSGLPVFVIDKGRAEKKSLITGKKKIFLKHTVERYSEVFAKAGFQIEPVKEASILPYAETVGKIEKIFEDSSFKYIGIAPFARHKLKMWPEEYMLGLLGLISENVKCRFLLFGGKEDEEKISVFQEKFPGLINAAGKFSLEEELALMSRLDLMISMDSSNMHMAALTGTKVISIWGGTDPMAGFGAWMQPDSFSIRVPVEELDCRPCTIYGKGETRNDFACMKRLTPELVYRRMRNLGVI